MNAVVHAPSTLARVSRSSRRASTRRAVSIPCQAVREHDFRLIADHTLDLSVEGMLLPLTVPVLTGETVIVSFEIPGAWIDAEATIARVVHGRRPGDDGLAVGLVFDVLSPSSRAALAGFLHGRPPPLPRRGPLARLRRGEAPPRLADEGVLELALAPPPRPTEDDAFALGVLREVGSAWMRLLAPT